MRTPHHAHFVKEIQRIGGGKYHLFDLFRDFCELAALSLVNAADRREHIWQQREDRYLRTINRYDDPADRESMARLLAHVINGLDAELCDFMGEVFGEMEQHNAAQGQFFTPFDVSYAIALITLGGRAPELESQPFIRVQEPSVGSGGMVLAFAKAMRQAGHNPQTQLHVVGVDVDSRAVHMAYIQLALAGIPAVLYVGNTLTMEMREEWKTPMHIMGGWDFRLQHQPATNAPAPIIKDTTGLRQADIFGEVAA
jgi:type I restriction-modification system DNA methylase subunit